MASSNGGEREPPPIRRVPPLAAVAVVGLLLLLVAAATPEAFIWLRHVGVVRVVLPDTPVVANYLLVALSLAFVIAALILRIMMVSRRRVDLEAHHAPLWSRLLAFAIVVALLRIAVASDRFRRGLGALSRRFAGPTPTALPSTSPSPALPHTTSRPLGIALTVLLALVLAAVVSGIVFLAGRVKGEVAPMLPADPVVEVLDAGIDDLRRIRDPRRAVIACYARMERLMSFSGIQRRLADTPTEFLGRVLRDRAVSASSVSVLTTLFERAKFSPHAIDEQMRDDALAALERVRSELALL
ncbi:MAG: DUF4129 domain-containing protein [Actinomycetota bacterium]|nr:DUF4129 domain-containing protein [Actinomycetota bacterium]